MTLEKEITDIFDRGHYALARIWELSDDLMGRIICEYFPQKGGDADITFTILRKCFIFPDKYCVYIQRGCEIPTAKGKVSSRLTANFVCKNKEDYQKIKQYVDSNNAEKVIDTMTKKIFDGKGLILPPLEKICIKKWDSLLIRLCTVQEIKVK